MSIHYCPVKHSSAQIVAADYLLIPLVCALDQVETEPEQSGDWLG